MAGGNFFSKLFENIFGGHDPESVKKRALKNIAKNFAKTKYHFYKPQSHEVEPPFAKFFYDIYKAVSPAQAMFEETNPVALKRVVINAFLSDRQKEALEEMDETSINEMAKKMSVKEVTKKISADIEIFAGEFDNTKIIKADNIYGKLVMFRNFCQYDYYAMLRKFDNSFRERSFSTPPKFSHLNGTYISEDLRNFMAVAWVLPFDSEWDDMFKLVKGIKGTDPMSSSVWRKMLGHLRSIKEKKVFEMMLQLINDNPFLKDEIKTEDYRIVDDYISQTRDATEKILKALQAKQTAGKVESLLTQIFGTTSVNHLKNYNEQNSAVFERKGIGSYAYAEPLSYLKQFLLDYTKKDIRELSDILLVRGEWANQQMAKPMSEAFNQLLGLSEKITALDDKMAENAEVGIKIKTRLPLAEREKESRNIIQTLLGDANDEAGRLILLSTKLFVTYDRNLKMLLEDFVKQPRSELIMNWKDLDHFAEEKLKQMCVDVYKKIYSFVTLMQNFPVEIENDEE